MNGTSGDVFSEFLVSRKKSGMNYAIIVLCCLLAAVLTVGLFLFIPSFMIIAIAAWVGVYFVVRLQKVEYEYIFTSGDLDIDQLTGDFRRKRKVSIKADTVEIIAPEKSESLAGYAHGNYKTFDFTTRDAASKQRFVIIGKSKSEAVRVIFEPNEKMVDNMWKCFPSKVKRV